MSEFETKEEVLKYINDTKDKFIVFKIGADWCKPCKKIKPFYNEVCTKNDYSSAIFYNLDVDSKYGSFIRRCDGPDEDRHSILYA